MLEDAQISHASTNNLQFMDFPLLKCQPVLPPDPNIVSEGDMVREANLELIHWVTVVLGQLSGLRIKTLAESTQNDGSRPDVMYFHIVPGNSIENSTNWKPVELVHMPAITLIDGGQHYR